MSDAFEGSFVGEESQTSVKWCDKLKYRTVWEVGRSSGEGRQAAFWEREIVVASSTF